MVVVTGASGGIGRACAHRAAGRGDHVVLVARGRAALDETAHECVSLGAASALVLTADVGDDAAVRDVVARTLQRHDRIDVWVNSAGVVAYGRTEDVPPHVFDGVLRTNLTGSVNVARHVLPEMRAQGRGSLVLVGSVIGHISVPTMSAYVLSKWAVRALARQLQLENRGHRDIRVVYVAPGGVDTPIYAQAANVTGHEGRPPPPVASPERTAKQILRRADGHPGLSQLSLANNVITFGHLVLPSVYAALVTPLFRLAAVDLTRTVPANDGNVMVSHEAGNKLHGDQGGAMAGILANLRASRRRIRPDTAAPPSTESGRPRTR